MKRRLVFLLGIMALSFIIYAFNSRDGVVKDGFVIVELYTSQGCSSCPNADKVLEDIGDIYKNKNVIPLGFHVDYWDRLGWKDTFSQHQFSERQYAYSQRFKNSSVYTPQMIVNGTFEFNGSNKTRALGLINKKIREEVSTKIEGEITLQGSNFIVDYNLSDIKHHLYDLNIALVRKEQKVSIKRGENSNRVITYHNIVIDFKQAVMVEKEGSLELRKPIDFKKEDYWVVIFLQEKNNGKIIAASRLSHS